MFYKCDSLCETFPHCRIENKEILVKINLYKSISIPLYDFNSVKVQTVIKTANYTETLPNTPKIQGPTKNLIQLKQHHSTR